MQLGVYQTEESWPKSPCLCISLQCSEYQWFISCNVLVPVPQTGKQMGRFGCTFFACFWLNIGTTRVVLWQERANNLTECAEQTSCVLSSHYNIPTIGNTLCTSINLTLLILLNCKLTRTIAFVCCRFVTVRCRCVNSTWSLLMLCCKARARIGEQYYPYLLRGESETWQLFLIYPLNLSICQLSCCSLWLVIATGKISTATPSGESECQLSFALSDVSEEMQAGGRTEGNCCLLVPSFLCLITEKKLHDHWANWSVCTACLRFCIELIITLERNWIKIRSRFFCSFQLFGCMLVFWRARGNLSGLGSLVPICINIFATSPSTWWPVDHLCWVFMLSSLVIPSFCPVEFRTPTLSWFHLVPIEKCITSSFMSSCPYNSVLKPPLFFLILI